MLLWLLHNSKTSLGRPFCRANIGEYLFKYLVIANVLQGRQFEVLHKGHRGKPSVPETEILLVLFFPLRVSLPRNAAKCSALRKRSLLQ